MLTDTYLLRFLHNHNPFMLERCIINSSSDCRAINGTINSDALWSTRWDLPRTSQAPVNNWKSSCHLAGEISRGRHMDL